LIEVVRILKIQSRHSARCQANFFYFGIKLNPVIIHLSCNWLSQVKGWDLLMIDVMKIYIMEH